MANTRLLVAARPDARVAILPGVGREIAWTPVAQRVVARWLAALPEPPL